MKVYLLTWNENWDINSPTPHRRLYFTQDGPKKHAITLRKRNTLWKQRGIGKIVTDICLYELDDLPTRIPF